MMNVETALKNAQEYVGWSIANDRLPSRYNGDPTEYRLNRWINVYRNQGTPYDEVNEYLVESLGRDVVEDREQKSARMARMYVSFCIKNNRYPCMRLDRNKSNIRRLVNWFDSYRRGVKSGGPMVEYEKTTSILKKYLGNKIFDSYRVFKIYSRPAVTQK